MNINSLTLYNFRNFRHIQEVSFPNASLLVAAAPNATGKTNLLEAIVVLLRGKSFRANAEECVQWDKDSFVITGDITRDDGENSRVSMQYRADARKVRIEEDGEPVSPVRFYGRYPYILFLPEDTFLFLRGPAMRRNFFNATLTTSPQYLSAIVQYQRVLRQRNTALKRASSPGDISAWTDILARHAETVWTHRRAFVQHLNARASGLFEEIFNEAHDIEVVFVPGAAEPERFAELLRDAWQYEQKYRHTLYGPHRDDIRVMVGGRSARSALSRGQMRALVIALKLAAFEFVHQLTNETPLLLCDEILSELDPERQRSLLEHLPKAQTLLTCTEIPGEVRGREGVYMLDLRSITRVGESEVESNTERAHRGDSEPEEGVVEVSQEQEEERVAVH